MLLSAFCFALMNAFAKVLSTLGIPSMQSVFFRSLIMVFLVLLVYFYNFSTHKEKKVYKKGGYISLFVRVIMGGLSFLAVFYNISTIPLGTAAAFAQTMPIYAVILGAIFLKERLSLMSILATIIGFIGILLISNPKFNGISLVNIFVGIFSGLSLAIAFVSLRGLKEYFSNIFLILAFGVGNTALGFLAMFLPFEGVGGFVLPNLATISGIILIIASGLLIATPSLIRDLAKLKKPRS